MFDKPVFLCSTLESFFDYRDFSLSKTSTLSDPVMLHCLPFKSINAVSEEKSRCVYVYRELVNAGEDV